MRSLVIGLAVAVAAGAAQAQPPEPPNPQAGQALEGATIIPLDEYEFRPRDVGLWSGLDMLEADLLGPGGEDIGDVEDILVGVDGYALAVVIELDEFLEFNETTLSIPLSTLEMLPEAGAIRAPIEPEGMEMYSVFDRRMLTARIVSNEVTAIADDDLGDVVTGSDVFLLEEQLLGEYAPLEDLAAFGYVHDVLFDTAGAVESVVISATAADPFGDLAVPYTGGTRSMPAPRGAAPFTAEELGVRD